MDKIFGKEKKDLAFHVVGSLKFSEHKELLDIPKKDLTAVPEYREDKVTAYRLQKRVYDHEMTVCIVHNPALLEGQLQGINDNIEKCIEKLNVLQQRLLKRKNGQIKKGKKPTAESAKKNLQDILSADYMQHIFETAITEEEEEGHILLDFNFSTEKLEYVKERYLGKTLLFTDNHDWSTAKIISAYRSLYHVESTFKQMKDTTFLGFKPVHHWTDQKIRVHAFYCVLALRLCCLLKRILYKNGITISINKMLSLLSNIKQVITVYPKKGESKKDREVYSISKLSPEQKKIADILDVLKYKLVG